MIHGCYANDSGALRVVDAEKVPPSQLPCPIGQTHLQRNQKGFKSIRRASHGSAHTAADADVVTAKRRSGEIAAKWRVRAYALCARVATREL